MTPATNLATTNVQPSKDSPLASQTAVPEDLKNGNCGKFDSLVINSLVLDPLSSTRESSATYVNLLGFKTKNQV
ncbi:hypothetical protein DSO57_1004198 [Entomophthora muscae]|uniref:Uncharacterized protein n=1 Tax=Entomophthora muscae TaxID=34485 RepID=A0ACC2RN74_9FUNG|nr:hypothetical protein DSO57_1004198 [Entomophthora muscae]